MPVTTVKSMSTDELLSGAPCYEFIGLAGPDGSGKTCALLSLAWYLEQTGDAKVFVGDTEKKFKAALKSYGVDAPHNIEYFPLDTMNDVNSATEAVLLKHKPGDWFAIESLDRIWEKAQDLAYQSIAGVSKVAYLERKGRKGAPIPQPDDFWRIAKGAHDSAFIDLLTDAHFDSLNVIATTTIARPPKEGGFMKDNADRKAARIELGINANLNGAPRLPYYFETLCLMDLKAGKVSCRILRDNNSTLDDSRVEFDVATRKDWAVNFWTQCRM